MNLRDDGGRSNIGLTIAKARYEYLPELPACGVSGIGGKCGPDPTSRKLGAFRTLFGLRIRRWTMGDHHIFGIAIPTSKYRAEKPTRDRNYLRFIRGLPCLVCCKMGPCVEAAHFGPHGIGQKASDLSAIPLCCLHHRKGPQSIHALGPVRFQEQHRLDIPAMIEKLNQFYARISRAA